MLTGNVKWFNASKGYGFILPDEGGTEVFAHYSAIESDGFRTLHAGQRVTFDLVEGDKGLAAASIKLLGEERPRSRGGRWLRRPPRPAGHF